jgi:hypothetical protein
MPPDRLDSWKEIASYLNKTIRTVQRWEAERHLPVHRIPAPSADFHRKGTVYAIPAELDRWLHAEQENIQADEDDRVQPAAELSEVDAVASTDGADEGIEPTPVRVSLVDPVRSRRLRPMALIAVCAVIPIGALLIWTIFSSARNPLTGMVASASPDVIAARVENGNQLVVSGADGKVLWSREFPQKILCGRLGGRKPQVADLGGASAKAIVIGFANDGKFKFESPDKVICLDGAGSLQWEFIPGAKLTWDGFSYPEAFRLWDYTVGSMAHGKKFFVVVANHEMYSPSQVAILDEHGKSVGEYWHTGWIFEELLTDLDGDGNDEIILGGQNDLYTKPFLAVIKYNIPRSISPVPKGFAPGFPAGKEIAYYLIPRTDAAEVLARKSRVYEIKRLDPTHITVGIQLPYSGFDIFERVYCLDLNFQTVRLDFPDEFQGLHKRLRQENRLDHDLLEADKQKLWPLERLWPPQKR